MLFRSWFAELELLRARLRIDFQVDITEPELVNHIVYNLKPRCYYTVLTFVKMQLNNGKTIQLEMLKRDIRQIYAQNHQSSDNKKDKEMALSTISGKGRQPFKKQFKGDCRICGKKGHKAINCWDSDKNKDKQPSNYKVNHQSLAQRASLKCNYCL